MFLPLITIIIHPTLPGIVPVFAGCLGVIINSILFTIKMINYLITILIKHNKEIAEKSVKQH